MLFRAHFCMLFCIPCMPTYELLLHCSIQCRQKLAPDQRTAAVAALQQAQSLWDAAEAADSPAEAVAALQRCQQVGIPIICCLQFFSRECAPSSL